MNIPNLLIETPQWIFWKQEIREGKATKVPCDVTGRPASVNNPASWYSYEDAYHLLAEQGSALSGLGFCFTQADPFVGIDLDDCLPRLKGDALEILRRFPTYAEVSPSGLGIKLIGLGDKGDVTKARTSEVVGFKQMEVYDRDRFFTITGNRWGVKDIEDVQDGLDWLIDQFLSGYGGEVIVSEPRRLIQGGSLMERAAGFEGTDEQLVAMVRENPKYDRLWLGDLSDYGENASSADAALLEAIAWYAGPVPDRIERVFDASALAQRDKWQRRSDYRKRSIEFALAGKDSFYSGSATRGREPEQKPVATEGKMYNITHLDDVEAQIVTWWLKEFIPKGMAVMLASAGGVIKGLYTIWAAANHIDGKVLYLGSEDNLSMIIKPRALAAGIDPDRFLPLRTVNLVDGTQVPIRFPKHAAALEQAIIDLDAKVVVIDAGPEHMQEDLQANSVEDVRRFMSPLNEIAERLNVTIFLILHTNKTQGAHGTDRISGNRAWVDAQRHVLLAAIDDEDDNLRHVQIGKTNISKQGFGWQYRIETKMIRARNRDTGAWEDTEIPYLVDAGPSSKDVNDLMNVKTKSKGDSKIDRAILEYVKGGRQDSKDVDEFVSETLGASARTVKNHRMELGKQGLLRAYPVEGDGGKIKKWQVEITWEGHDYLGGLNDQDGADW